MPDLVSGEVEDRELLLRRIDCDARTLRDFDRRVEHRLSALRCGRDATIALDAARRIALGMLHEPFVDEPLLFPCLETELRCTGFDALGIGEELPTGAERGRGSADHRRS